MTESSYAEAPASTGARPGPEPAPGTRPVKRRGAAWLPWAAGVLAGLLLAIGGFAAGYVLGDAHSAGHDRIPVAPGDRPGPGDRGVPGIGDDD